MTTKIHLLSPEQAQKIAAGEVIERPANVVKELVENSVDAGATSITIHIEKAGKKLIRITDDGCGMSPEDAERCFGRHATSKLSSVDQLMSLDTFGFRGEALASIAAISKVILTTREASSQLGTRVIYAHGSKQSIESVACSVGTTIQITELFDTVPVRKSFLKQDETEWNQIISALTGLALTHQKCSFKIVKDDSVYLNAPRVTTLQDRITQLWGHNLSQQLTSLCDVAGSSGQASPSSAVTVTGQISTPPFARYGKQQVVLFVNNRLVKNSDLVKAVLKGYKQALPPGKYPVAVLFIQIDRGQVDVNIHPRKEEVRFTKPGVVTRVIQERIITTLESNINKRLGGLTFEPAGTPLSAPLANISSIEEAPIMPSSVQTYHQPSANTLSSPAQAAPVLSNTQPHNQVAVPVNKKAALSTEAPLGPKVLGSSNASAQQATSQAEAKPVEKPHQHSSVEPAAARVIGQLFATYIIIEQDDELILVDQHAAHERILYHQFADTFTGKEGTGLLFPETISLPESAVAAISKYADFFADQGIAVHQSGPTHIAITSSPPKLQKESLAQLLTDASDFIQEHESLDKELFMRRLNEHVHSHMACKAAVRAGDRLDTDTMQSLVEQLMRTPNRFMCVHGRPTMLPFARADLEKKFRRR